MNTEKILYGVSEFIMPQGVEHRMLFEKEKLEELFAKDNIRFVNEGMFRSRFHTKGFSGNGGLSTIVPLELSEIRGYLLSDYTPALPGETLSDIEQQLFAVWECGDDVTRKYAGMLDIPMNLPFHNSRYMETKIMAGYLQKRKELGKLCISAMDISELRSLQVLKISMDQVSKCDFKNPFNDKILSEISFDDLSAIYLYERSEEMYEKKNNVFQKGNLLVTANELNEFSVFSYVADMDTKRKQIALVSFTEYGKLPVSKDGLRIMSMDNLIKDGYYRLATKKEKEVFNQNADKKLLRPSDEAWAKVLIKKVEEDIQHPELTTDLPDRKKIFKNLLTTPLIECII